MKVRAKFRLTEWKNQEGWTFKDGKSTPGIKSTLVFIPVGDDTPENKKFWEATPSGRIELTMVNPEAIKEFTILKEYYVDFIAVDASLHLPPSTGG